mmetsp:Transcript_17311/g.35708  ORF Transcript_17311/g.35708 Transcript_17311/m.35708 type:complete len:207 (-) Transcript_17311:2713-3333(-)
MVKHAHCAGARNSCLNPLYSIAMVSIVHRNAFDAIAITTLEETTSTIGVTNVLETSRTTSYLSLLMFRYERNNSRRRKMTKHMRKVGFNVTVASDGYTRFAHSLIPVKIKISDPNLPARDAQSRNARRPEDLKPLLLLQWLKTCNVQNFLNLLKATFVRKWMSTAKILRKKRLRRMAWTSRKRKPLLRWEERLQFVKLLRWTVNSK